MLAGVSLLLLPFQRGVDKAWNDLLSAGGVLSTLTASPNQWVRDQARALLASQSELETRARNFRVAFDQSDYAGNTAQLVREAPQLQSAIQAHKSRVTTLQSQAATGQVPLQQAAGWGAPSFPSASETTEWIKQNWMILALAGIAVVAVIQMQKG